MMNKLVKQVLPPRASALQQLMLNTLMIFAMLGGAGGLLFVSMKVAAMNVGVSYRAPTINIPAPVESCLPTEYLVYEKFGWYCQQVTDYQPAQLFSVYGNAQLGNSAADTIEIHGRLIVNGVDITPND